MYAILGATGQVGRAVVASLAADGHAARMRLIGRTPSADAPAGAAWHHADLRAGPAALAAALEAALAAGGARTTFVRATSFMQNRVPIARAALASGTWHAMFAPDLPLPAVSADDVGRCVARMLRDPDPPRIVNVTGAGTWSEREVARLVASLAGRPLAVEAVPPAHRAAALQAAGLGRSYAEALAQMHAAFEAGAAAFAPADLEVAGEESFEDVLRRALA